MSELRARIALWIILIGFRLLKHSEREAMAATLKDHFDSN